MVREAWAAVDAVVPPPGVAFTVAAHAPYSTSPPLVAEIARRRREAPLAIHLGESPEEIEFLRTGRGPFRELLEELGAWHPAWQPPECDPVEYLSRLGYLQRGVLAVHAVHLSDDALARLADAGAVVVTCPRSNEWVGAGLPRVSHFYAAGLPVAIGTDSLASAPTLNLFDELAELRRIAPDVAASALLDSATRQGARALGAGADFGTISTGQARGAHRGHDSGRRRRMWKNTWSAACRRRRSAASRSSMLSRLRTYASFVRFSHSVFALPFALVGALLATRYVDFEWIRLIWIVLCMVTARSAAMGFNRLVDARFDARNPRTAGRELPAGRMSRIEAQIFVARGLGRVRRLERAAGLAVSAACRRWRSPSCSGTRWPSATPPTLRRFSGLAMAVAPVGGWIAAGGPPSLEPWLLGLAIGTLGRRLRHPVRLSGSGVRSCAKGCARFRSGSASGDRSRSRARCTS